MLFSQAPTLETDTGKQGYCGPLTMKYCILLQT